MQQKALIERLQEEHFLQYMRHWMEYQQAAAAAAVNEEDAHGHLANGTAHSAIEHGAMDDVALDQHSPKRNHGMIDHT